MNKRPFILKGNIFVNNYDEYIIGKIVKNNNVEDKSIYIQVLDMQHLDLFSEGYKGYIFEDKPINLNLKNINYCCNINNYETLIDNDVVEIVNNEWIRLLYRDDSDDNAIVVTNQCNSNCIMCPDSDMVRDTKENPNIKKLLEHIRCIPDDTKHITITGGEPGMLKYNLVRLLRECKEHLPNTDFLLLSNGRVFANTQFTNQIFENVPQNFRIAMPIYADNEILHDEITRVKGSFEQTVRGIKNLIDKKIDIEIRIVVLKKNYKQLKQITSFIVKEIPEVKMVNIMALEMTGNAYKNREEVWINFDEIKNELYSACIETLKAGIITNLYNFPLCKIDERLYSISHRSITDYKVRYKEACAGCSIKDECGGFFNSTINVKDIEVKPIMIEG